MFVKSLYHVQGHLGSLWTDLYGAYMWLFDIGEIAFGNGASHIGEDASIFGLGKDITAAMMDIPCCSYLAMENVVTDNLGSMSPTFFVGIERHFVIVVLNGCIIAELESKIFEQGYERFLVFVTWHFFRPPCPSIMSGMIKTHTSFIPKAQPMQL